MDDSNRFHHERYLGALSTTAIQRIDKRTAVLVQPIGAFEQHGPHLPVITDALTAERITALAMRRLSITDNAWQLPTLAYGKSNEHLGRAGTVSMSASTLIAVCMDLGRSLAASGFTKLLFVNGHGGQPGLLELVARDIRVETGMQVFCVMPSQFPLPEGISQVDTSYGIHGGQIETSVVWALAPEMVDMSAAVRDGDVVEQLYADSAHLSLEGVAPTAWVTDDLSLSGVFGDPTAANLQDGQSIVESQAANLAELIGEVQRFAFPTLGVTGGR
ncbi:creatininase family protein [uncultured Microbacterium sp.]|uniref:creatininase family protein n=1 Tax=uncultured Microbacterium sp. TaxID=191216 RepID=UPI0035CB35AA